MPVFLLLQVMADFEYHIARVRQACQSTDGKHSDLCQSLLAHLDAMIFDTRSAFIASSTSTSDAQQVQDLVRRLYDENHRIADHIDQLIEQNEVEEPTSDEQDEHIRRAIEHIELALDEHHREQQRLRREREHDAKNDMAMVAFVQTTDRLHNEALNKLREHIKQLREQNQSLGHYNEQIDLLTRQVPDTLFLSSK